MPEVGQVEEDVRGRVLLTTDCRGCGTPVRREVALLSDIRILLGMGTVCDECFEDTRR